MKAGREEAKANKVREIIQATYSVVLEQGYCNASTQRIAQKAGVTKSILHYYFKNKDHLMLETNKYVIEKLIHALGEITSQHSDDPDKMEKRILVFWEMMKKNIDIMMVLYATSINSLYDPDIRQKFGEIYGLILEVVKTNIASEHGHLNIPPRDVEVIASIIIGGLESLIHHYMVNPDITDFDYSVKTLTRIITNAMKAY
ncbi:MAG: TetR/AcrR family transcriptional regulator [Desulfosalsimonadaceae bacterium]